MLPKKNSPQNNLYKIYGEKLASSLIVFKKKLEKNFFAEVTIQDSSSKNDIESIIVDIHCNYKLSEIVTYIDNGSWGNIYENERPTPFIKAFSELQEKNNTCKVDIEEFIIHFNDTCIIINKIYDYSIPEQLENILTQLANHYTYYTKGHTEMPYEIYIPVFEENIFVNSSTILDTKVAINTKDDYFKYWALYFTYMEDAVIYDLDRKLDINASLFMINS